MGEDKTMFIMFRGEQLLFTGLGIGERWRTLSDEAELRGDGGKEAADTTTHTANFAELTGMGSCWLAPSLVMCSKMQNNESLK